MSTRRQFLFGARPAPPAPSARVLDTCFELHGVVCRNCADACSRRAVRFLPLGGGSAKPVIDPARCDACGECLPACPASAIQLTALEPHA
jgi:ferredoxin-type protein NapF